MNLQQVKQIINLTKESYNNIAVSFSDSRSDNWPEVESLVKRYIDNNNKILDIGCGNGRLVQLLKNYKNINYTGLDNSEKLIANVKKEYLLARQGVLPRHNIKINFILDDILNLDKFETNSFDKIFMIASFNHIPSQELQEKVLINLYRILKNNGILIMTNWNLWQIRTKKNIWQYLWHKNIHLRQSYGRQAKTQKHLNIELGFKDVITYWQNKYPLYYYAFTSKELRKLFTKSGFKILENKYKNKNKSAHWYNGRNIVSIGRKIVDKYF